MLSRLMTGYRAVLGTAAPSTSDGLALRDATRADVDGIARLHEDALTSAFLTRLGRRFLALVYRALIADPGAVVLVAHDRGRLAGFVAGVESTGTFYRRFLWRQGLRAALAAAPALIRAGTLKRIRETATYSRSSRPPRSAELLSIAIAEPYRARGLGARLTSLLVEELTNRGADRVLVVNEATNVAANRLYESAGFRLYESVQVHDGTTSNVWMIECHSSYPSPLPSS